MSKAIKIKLTPAEGEYDLGTSKFFGDPTLPANWQDKYDDDVIFLGQIRLEQIAHLDPENRLPHTGYLYFFLDTAYDFYELLADYYDGEPDTVLEEFNEMVPEFEHLTKAYIMSFEECDEGEDGHRLFGIPSSGYEPDGADDKLLLQFDPLDTVTGFLDDIDGYAYVFCDESKKDIADSAYFVIDRS